MLFASRNPDAALVMVHCSNGLAAAEADARNTALLHGIPANFDTFEADEWELPDEAIRLANRFGSWVNPGAPKGGGMSALQKRADPPTRI